MARRTHTEAWWAAAGPSVLRCTARYKSDGLQCRTEAAPGTSVCNKHGALAPQVVNAAAVRIQMTADDAVKFMRRVLEDPNAADRDKVTVAKDLLDRAGLQPTNKLVVGIGQLDPIEQLFQSILSDPNATFDPSLAGPKQILPDPVQAALDAAEDGSEWGDLLGLENGSQHAEDVVDAELVEDTEPTGRAAVAPPPHIREGLGRTDALRRAGLW